MGESGDTLTVDSFIVRPGDTVRGALERMTLNRRGVVFVCDHERHLIGALSDGDVRRSLLEGTVLESPVGKVMNPDPVLGRSVADAEQLLRQQSVVAVPVVSELNELVGIVTTHGDHIEVLEVDTSLPSPPSTGAAVAIVPARGGSRRLPRKNLALLDHRPLVVWAIEAALASDAIDRVILSTDDEEIAAVGRSAGAEVPWLRPAALAGDDSPTIAVVEHAMGWLRDQGSQQIGVLLEPTSPIRPAGLVDEVVLALETSEADAAATVTAVPHTLNPEEQLRLEDGRLTAFVGDRSLDSRRLRGEQVETFIFTGQAYAFRPATVFDKASLFGDVCVPVVRSWHEWVDIDEAADLARAESTLRRSGSAPAAS